MFVCVSVYLESELEVVSTLSTQGKGTTSFRKSATVLPVAQQEQLARYYLVRIGPREFIRVIICHYTVLVDNFQISAPFISHNCRGAWVYQKEEESAYSVW